MTDYVVRPARAADLDALMELARLSGPGFTSLPEDPGRLAATLAASQATFTDPTTPIELGHFLMMLEDRDGAVMGSAAVKPAVGVCKPFFNFKIVRITQASYAAERRFDMDVLMLANEHVGCTEIGTLFLRPQARGAGVGRLLAQSRYLLMAAAPERFSDTVLAELRGVVDAAGHAPFWEHLGARFFHMTFQEADELSATSDNQFILDLMPRYPIYVDLLAEEARAVIGQTHPDGVAALRLLEEEGFRFANAVDIFDAGPLVIAPRAQLRTIRESRRRLARASTGAAFTTSRALISNDRLESLRVTRAPICETHDAVELADDVWRRLDLSPGDAVRIWTPAPAPADAAQGAHDAATQPTGATP